MDAERREHLRQERRVDRRRAVGRAGPAVRRGRARTLVVPHRRVLGVGEVRARLRVEVELRAGRRAVVARELVVAGADREAGQRRLGLQVLEDRRDDRRRIARGVVDARRPGVADDREAERRLGDRDLIGRGGRRVCRRVGRAGRAEAVRAVGRVGVRAGAAVVRARLGSGRRGVASGDHRDREYEDRSHVHPPAAHTSDRVVRESANNDLRSKRCAGRNHATIRATPSPTCGSKWPAQRRFATLA